MLYSEMSFGPCIRNPKLAPTAFPYANLSRQFEALFTFIPHPVLTPLSHHIIYYLYKCQTRGAHSQAVLFSPP
jgi:hypothetical protein